MGITRKIVASSLVIVGFIFIGATALGAQAMRPDVGSPAESLQIDPNLTGALAASETNGHPARSEAASRAIKAVRLSLMDAIRFSLQGNREIGVVAYAPKQAQEEINTTTTVFDPILFSDASYRRDPNLVTSINNIVTEDNGVTRTGVRKPLETGGSLAAYLETRYGDLNNAEFDRVFKNLVAPTLELRQPLLLGIGSKKEKTAIEIAGYQANISKEEFRQKVIETANNVARVYWQLYLFKELMAVNRKNLDMAEKIYRREAERLARGLSQQLDVERARSNVLSRRVTLLRSQEDFRISTDRLKLLMNWRQLRIDSDIEVIPIQVPQTKPLPLIEEVVVDTALTHRPEIIKIKQEVMIRKTDEELAAHQRLPKLDAYGRYGVSGYGEDFNSAIDDIALNEDNVWEVGINFEWAIGNRSASSEYRRKKLRRIQADAQLKSIEDDIKLDIKQVLLRIATTINEIESTRLAKGAAEKVVEGEFIRFDIGQTSNIELFRAQDLLALASRTFLRAIADYNIALHDLERAQGLLPDGVTIDEAKR